MCNELVQVTIFITGAVLVSQDHDSMISALKQPGFSYSTSKLRVGGSSSNAQTFTCDPNDSGFKLDGT